mgnify:CR=1 FL=1
MYDELYQAWRKERENSELQPLPRDFYRRLTDYVKRVREAGRMIDERTVKGRLVKREAENVRRLAKELMETRLNKIIHMILEGKTVPVSTLTEEEAALYENLSPQIESHQKLIENILRGRLPEVKGRARESNLMVVRILREVPAIIGADMKTYGPFKPEDVAALPRENAKLLIKQGVAVEIETM